MVESLYVSLFEHSAIWNIVIIAALLLLSFLRDFFVGRWVQKKYERKEPYSEITVNFGLRIFLSLTASEICAFLFYYSIASVYSGSWTTAFEKGIILTIKDAAPFWGALIWYCVGVLLWAFLSVAFILIFLRYKDAVSYKDRLKLASKSVLPAVPFFMVFQLFLLF